MEKVNLDTNILINYIHSYLPVDKEYPDCDDVLTSNNSYCVIGGKVRKELDKICDRRNIIYKDIINWYRENPEKSLYDYDITSRDVYNNNPNDKNHVRYDVQCEIGDESPEKILSELRRCTQRIDTLQREVFNELLDRIYKSYKNPSLYSKLNSSLRHDRDVIVDAVEIQKKDDIEMLISCDSDLLDNGDSINNTICDVEDESCTLTIRNPSAISDEL